MLIDKQHMQQNYSILQVLTKTSIVISLFGGGERLKFSQDTYMHQYLLRHCCYMYKPGLQGLPVSCSVEVHHLLGPQMCQLCIVNTHHYSSLG